MDADEILRKPTAPLGVTSYLRRPALFTDREYFNVVYRTDVDAARRVVPEPLTVAEPLVRFEVMKMGDVEGFGPYLECGQLVAVNCGGESGEYLRAMYVDNVPALIGGRELSAYPKLHGSPGLFVDDGALVGTLDRGAVRVATATMAYKWRPMDLDVAKEVIGTPGFAVKTVPDAVGGGLLQAALLRMQITDLTVLGAWSGPARLQLFEHVMAPLSDLPVREIVSASHIVTSLRLPSATLVHDYLDRPPRARGGLASF